MRCLCCAVGSEDEYYQDRFLETLRSFEGIGEQLTLNKQNGKVRLLVRFPAFLRCHCRLRTCVPLLVFASVPLLQHLLLWDDEQTLEVFQRLKNAGLKSLRCGMKVRRACNRLAPLARVN